MEITMYGKCYACFDKCKKKDHSIVQDLQFPKILQDICKTCTEFSCKNCAFLARHFLQATKTKQGFSNSPW